MFGAAFSSGDKVHGQIAHFGALPPNLLPRIVSLLNISSTRGNANSEKC